MRYATDQAVAQIDALRDLAPEERDQVIADAGAVYAHVRAHEWIQETDLRAWAEGQDLDPDRVNAAVAFLEETGRLNHFNDTTPAAAETLEAVAAPDAGS